MILNIINNERILKQAFNIDLKDFTILTGENGSGKTQLLQHLINYANGVDINGLSKGLTYPLLTDDGIPLKEILYSYPGLRNGIYQQQQPTGEGLLNNIKLEWSGLETAILAYHMLRDKLFENQEKELESINAAITRMAVQIFQPQQYGSHPPINLIQIHHIQQIKRLSANSGKPPGDLKLIDMIIFYISSFGPFSTALDLLFHQFHLKGKYYPHLTSGITPPWDIFNEILSGANFKYRAEYTESENEDETIPVRLIDNTNGNQVAFEHLSSGETTIMALIFALYNSSNNSHFPEVILFDEPDAHLHPSLTQTFLDVIQNVLIKEHNVKVILTTHSPSTVALSPDDCIYIMQRDFGRPIKGDRKSALSILSNGLASMTIEESRLGIAYNIGSTPKHILFTEGITDKIILERAWEKLYPEKEMNFFIQDSFDASFLGNLFGRGDDKPDGIFHQFPNQKMIALFDFDNMGYNSWNRDSGKFDTIEDDPKKCLTRSNGHNGLKMLLPVPEIAEIIRQVIKDEKSTYKENSYLTIESLLFNVPTLKTFFNERHVTGGGTIHVINDKSKRELANTVNTLDTSDFIFFKPLFESITKHLT